MKNNTNHQEGKGATHKPLIFLLVIILLAVLVFVWWPKISPHKAPHPATLVDLTDKINPPEQRWLTYTSETWGFSLKYPEGWFSEELQTVTFADTSDTTNPQSIVVTVFRNSDVNFMSLQEQQDYYLANPSEFAVLGELTVGDYTGLEIDFVQRNQRQAIIRDTAAAGAKIYTIFVTYPEEKEAEALQIYERMYQSLEML